MIKLSIKLISLILFAIFFSLLFVGISFDFYIKDIFIDSNKQNFIQSFKNTANELKKMENDIIKSSKLLASEPIVQSTVRLINIYEDKKNYKNDLLDQPKKDLAEFLLRYIKLSNHSQIDIYDQNGFSVVCAKYIKKLNLYQSSFVSYLDNKPRLNIRLENQIFWDSRKMITKKSHSDHLNLHYNIEDRLLKLNSHIYIETPNQKKIGMIDILKNLTHRDIQQFSSSDDIILTYSLGKNIPNKKLITYLFFKLNQKSITIIEEAEIFKSYASIPQTKKDFIYIKAIASKKQLIIALQNSRMILLIITLFVASLIGIFSLIIIKNIVTLPMKRLMSNIKDIKNNNYKNIRVIEKNDEFGEVSQSFNEIIILLKKREYQLVESKNNLKKAQSIAKLGSWELIHNTQMIKYSDEMFEILRKKKNRRWQVFNMFERYVNKEDEVKFKTLFNNSIKKNRYFELKHKILREDNSIGYVQSKANHKYDESGNIIKTIGTMLDITKIKNLEQSNLQKEQMLFQQSKMASMGEMIGNIAHQWRQPIAIISMWANNIIVDIDMEEIDEKNLRIYADNINIQTQHLSQTIDDFRKFFIPNKQKNIFYLKQSIDKTIKLLKASFKNHNIEVIKNIEDIEITALENELTQALLNIIKNAKDILVTLPVNMRKLIFIDIYQKNNVAYIQIKDNGGGIDKEIIDKIYEPYFTTKHKNQGTGIGLYMTQSIIIKHLQGEIYVENVKYEYKNKTYEGAEFKIKIPLI